LPPMWSGGSMSVWQTMQRVGLLVLIHETRAFQTSLPFAPITAKLGSKCIATGHRLVMSASTTPMIRGENNRLAYASTGSACLNLYQGAVKGVDKDDLLDQVAAAWEENPDHCVRLIFHMGDVRQGGKMDKELYYRALMWMYRTKPKSFVRNLQFVPRHSVFKDLLNLLMFCHAEHLAAKNEYSLRFDTETYLHDAAARRGRFQRRSKGQRGWERRGDRYSQNAKKMQRLSSFLQFALEQYPERFRSLEDLRVPRREPHPLANRDPMLQNTWTSAEAKARWLKWSEARSMAIGKEKREAAKKLRSDVKQLATASRQDGGLYASVYDFVADTFANALKEDATAVDGGLPSYRYGGLAAKWAPTPRGMHDKNTAIVAGIVERLFPPEEFKLEEGTYDEYLSFMTDRYRREYLSRLRGHAEIPEHFTGTGRWSEVNYKRMASRCRYIFGETFRKHDTERYDAFLLEAARAKVESRKTGKSKKGAAKVAASALFPHEIMQRARQLDRRSRWDFVVREDSQDDESGFENLPGEDVRETKRAARMKEATMAKLEVNQQWASLVDSVRDAGKIESCLAVCDVSGSMEGKPMDVAVSLSLLLAEIAEEPWRGLICTFSATPQLVRVKDMPQARSAPAPSIDGDANTRESTLGEGEPEGEAATIREQKKTDDAKKEDESNTKAKEGGESLEALAEALGDLASRAHEVTKMQCSWNTNFVAVFDRLLETTVRRQLKPEAMVKTVFVFSDMEFDEARVDWDGDWATAHEEVERKFAMAGYALPTIVYWNLRGDSKSIPVTGDKRGTVLVGGFSAGLMKAFLSNAMAEYSPFGYLAQTVLENPKWAHLSAHPDEAAQENPPES